MSAPRCRGARLISVGTVPAIGQGPFRRFQNVWGANVIVAANEILGPPPGKV